MCMIYEVPERENRTEKRHYFNVPSMPRWVFRKFWFYIYICVCIRIHTYIHIYVYYFIYIYKIHTCVHLITWISWTILRKVDTSYHSFIHTHPSTERSDLSVFYSSQITEIPYWEDKANNERIKYSFFMTIHCFTLVVNKHQTRSNVPTWKLPKFTVLVLINILLTVHHTKWFKARSHSPSA